MTINYNNVYILNSSTLSGPNENNGPLSKYFDLKTNDLYYGEKSWEKAESKMVENNIKNLLEKEKLSNNSIDLIITGDLENQITASTFGIKKYNIPCLGIYSACSTFTEGIIIGSNFIESNNLNSVIVSTSSHINQTEKQFRNPIEYGAPKPRTSTITSTGAASLILTNKKTNIKIDSVTIGKIVDLEQNNPNFVGAAMAPAAANTLFEHLNETKRTINYYDLILSGDLGLYGKKIMIDIMKQKYNINISKNYNDCGCMLYDLDNQKNMYSGGSGPVCCALVFNSYILKKLKEKKYKKVLLLATGALFSQNSVCQKRTIPSISHAISVEVI